jgi:hypothetical protein
MRIRWFSNLNRAGGSGGYLYSNNNIAFTTSATFYRFSRNLYFFVRDSKVVQVQYWLITEPSTITTNATATAFTCNSTTNANQSATITVAPTGGTGTYTYSYDNGGSYGQTAR